MPSKPDPFISKPFQVNADYSKAMAYRRKLVNEDAFNMALQTVLPLWSAKQITS